MLWAPTEWREQPELLVRLARVARWERSGLRVRLARQGPKAWRGRLEPVAWRELQEPPLGLVASERKMPEAPGEWAHRRQRWARRRRVSTRR